MPQHLAPNLISWASILDPQTAEQAIRASKMPFVKPHLALMPDAHLGKGATVGSVIPTLGAIMPAAVGVDIGCGMIAHRTQFTAEDILSVGFTRDERGVPRPSALSSLREGIERRIPLSVGKHNDGYYDDRTKWHVEKLAYDARTEHGFLPDAYAMNWRSQLGSLGSGNHFIEVSLDEEDRVWLFLHSGSRGIGNKIAQHHIKVSQAYCEKHFISLPDRDLAYLVEGTEEFDRYIAELCWAQAFALANREEMMRRVTDAFEEWVGEAVVVDEAVNCHHNFTQQERHFGHDVWLSRKGAIEATLGKPGLIPGSMGTRSYVVKGKGNRVAMDSAPHGAGREYSRSRAKATFTGADLEAAMVGIEYRKTDAFIDEIPAAYKDIDVVMEDASSLVEVKHELRQIVNVKGD